MSRVEEIKAAIDRLSFEERCELNALLNPQPNDEWDGQMQADARPGAKLHRVMLEAEAETETGRLTDFPSRKEG